MKQRSGNAMNLNSMQWNTFWFVRMKLLNCAMCIQRNSESLNCSILYIWMWKSGKFRSCELSEPNSRKTDNRDSWGNWNMFDWDRCNDGLLSVELRKIFQGKLEIDWKGGLCTDGFLISRWTKPINWISIWAAVEETNKGFWSVTLVEAILVRVEYHKNQEQNQFRNHRICFDFSLDLFAVQHGQCSCDRVDDIFTQRSFRQHIRNTHTRSTLTGSFSLSLAPHQTPLATLNSIAYTPATDFESFIKCNKIKTTTFTAAAHLHVHSIHPHSLNAHSARRAYSSSQFLHISIYCTHFFPSFFVSIILFFCVHTSFVRSFVYSSRVSNVVLCFAATDWRWRCYCDSFFLLIPLHYILFNFVFLFGCCCVPSIPPTVRYSRFFFVYVVYFVCHHHRQWSVNNNICANINLFNF